MKIGEVGKFIAFLRREKGLSQAALAKIICVDETTVSKWERGKGLPDVSLFPSIAEEFGISVDCLMQGYRNQTMTKDLSDKELCETLTNEQKKLILKEANALRAKSVVRVVAIVLAVLYLVFSVGYFVYAESGYRDNSFVNKTAALYIVDLVKSGNHIEKTEKLCYKAGDEITVCLDFFVPTSFGRGYELNYRGQLIKYRLTINGEEIAIDFSDEKGRFLIGDGGEDGGVSYRSYISLTAEEVGSYELKPFVEVEENGKMYVVFAQTICFDVVREYSNKSGFFLSIVEAERKIKDYQACDFLVRLTNLTREDATLSLAANRRIGFIVLGDGSSSFAPETSKQQAESVTLHSGQSIEEGFSFLNQKNNLENEESFFIRAFCSFMIEGEEYTVYSDDVSVTRYPYASE